ncbi:MAG: hypothetical protein V3T48_07980, partial [Vicinamibacterales bacterium]
MIARLFHAWERRLAAVTTDRVVRSFEWGLDWIGDGGHSTSSPQDAVAEWSTRAMVDTDRFFETPPTD